MTSMESKGLSEILDRVPDAIFAVDRTWEISFVNATAAALTGRSPEDLIGTLLWDSFPELKGTSFEQEIRQSMASGARVTVEEFIEVYGFWAEIQAFPSRGGFTIYLRDRTERRLADEMSRYQDALLNSVRRAVIGTDAAGIVKFWNQAAAELYGWTRDEAIGQNILELTPAAMSRQQADEILHAVQRGDRWQGQFPVKKKDGSNFTAHVTDTPIFDGEGKLLGILGISYDVNRAQNAWG
jgi:PAS domain S-box-containing protein